MRLAALLLLPVFWFSSLSPASADVTLSIDLDTLTDGVQSEITVVNGGVINAAVVMTVTGATRFSAYDFILDFEQSTLTYGPNILNGLTSDPVTGERNVPIATNRLNKGIEGIISLSPLQVYSLGPLTDDDPLVAPDPDPTPIINSITGIAAGTSGTRLGVGFTPIDNTSIYEFTLAATNIGTSNLALRGASTPFLEAENLGTVTFGTGLVNVTAVPEPTTWAACSFALGAFAVRYRRKRKAAPAAS